MKFRFVCLPASQPAVRPGCTRHRVPEISHDKGNGSRFTKMLFQRQFTHCTMAIPFILCSSSLFYTLARCKSHFEGDDSLLQLLLITSHKTPMFSYVLYYIMNNTNVFICTLLHHELQDYSLGQITFCAHAEKLL